MIKSPVDLTVGLCGSFKCLFPAASGYVDQYGLWEQVRNQAAGMQQNIGDPPNVAGWQAYYQTPEYDKLWISRRYVTQTQPFSDRMINNGFTRNGKKAGIDVLAFATGLPAPEDPDRLIADSVQALLAIPLPPEQLQFIKTSILLSGLVGMNSDHYWTNAWQACSNNPEDKTNYNGVINKLKNLYRHLMDLPEYQLL